MSVRLWTRAGGVALATIAVATVLSACGGSSAKTATAGKVAPGGQVSLQAYVTCLNQNGVKITVPSRNPGARPSGGFPSGVRPSGGFPSGVRPSGGFGGGGFGGSGGGAFGGGLFGDANNPPTGVDATTWKNALAACKSVQPSFGGGAGRAGGLGGGAGGTALQAYRNCLTSHGVSASTGTGRLNTADPTIAAAVKTCAPLLPTGRPTTAPSPTS